MQRVRCQVNRRLGFPSAAVRKLASQQPCTARTAEYAVATQSTAGSSEAAFRQLVDWIQFHGGTVHPSLTLVDNAPCGCRGVVATAPITATDLQQRALAEIPNELRISIQFAWQQLQCMLGPQKGRDLEMLHPDIVLALYIAAERAKGSKSHWSPYIESLPLELPCGWTMSEDEMEAALLPYGERVASFPDQLMALRLELDEIVEEATPIMDALGLQREDVVWAFGHVQSRSYRRDMVPLFDLINHHPDACPPIDFGALEVQQPHYPIYPSVKLGPEERITIITSWMHDWFQPLDAGDELYVNYLFAADYSAFDAFADFGFIPPDCS